MSNIKALPFCFSIALVATCASSQAIDLRQAETAVATSDAAVFSPLPSNEINKEKKSVSSPAACHLFSKETVIDRTALATIIDAGLGRWLANVEGDRSISKGRFQGWIIKQLHPNDPCYQHCPVRPGDVVLRINNKSIEKPEQAFEVFESLRLASGIRIEYLRQGKIQIAQFEIDK
jgi:type II secretory pathway component PulC